MGRSGKLIATNDIFIEKLINDRDYKIKEDGTIWVNRNLQGHHISEFRQVKFRLKDGYLSFKYKHSHLRVSRVLYRFFYGYLESDMVINHIDGNTINNSRLNLELITQSENNIHRFRILGHKQVRNNCKFTNDEIKVIRNIYSIGDIGLKKLSKIYNVSKSTIRCIVKYKTYKHVA